ncbi:hypothetical protein CAPTEDRAFT_227940 [Capitella teleta]|uniref:Uncharacterized protein n=1 Tax=Capitella teleta TaxID=283909 RepID=R7TJR8_CAPTE|nr:hypothetical protein CAPTEDRAFT_227940 [Capitella teleta]|eukprot:ELT94073.1 hypothetical protein CAPTEDRAFT_227940 [Capitella teleta]
MEDNTEEDSCLLADMATDKDYIQIAKEPYSSSEYDSSNDDETSMSTSSSSSKSWEILSGPEPDLEGSIDVEALAAAAADEEPEAGSLVGSVSREAKQVLEGLRLEMRELSGGCSVIASGVDKVTTGISEKLNKAISDGARSAETVVSNFKMDWLEKDDEEPDNANGQPTEQRTNEAEGDKAASKVLRKITSVIYNRIFTHQPARTAYGRRLFTHEPSAVAAPSAPRDLSKESVGFLRLQAVWHCFEKSPRVGVSLGTEPTPSNEAESLSSLDVAESTRLRCVTKELDMADGDYYVQSVTVSTEEIGSIAMVGKSFEKLIQKFKAL